MPKWFSALLAALLLLPLLISCGSDTPAEVPGSSGEDSGSEVSQTLEPITDEPETDPFEGAEPLPADLSVPDNVRLPDGTVIGTIVLPAGSDGNEATAAEELRYHIRKVTGADLPVVGRPGEGYGSLIVCTPASLPAVTELFAEDIAWLSDLGSAESGSRFGSDGFSIRSVGKDVYILGNTSRGTLNGAYDLLEENFGILWVRADEDLGTVYETMPEAVISKTDYREKSPFEYRGWNLCGLVPRDESTMPAALRLCSRNKENSVGASVTDPYYLPFGHTIKDVLLSSPVYDPEETEYWATDEAGNPMSAEESPQPNPFSEKTVEALAASVIQIMQTRGTRKVFLGAEDNEGTRFAPWDTQPFEYAPGPIVNPEDENYYSTVIHTMIGKVARIVRETVPDGLVGTWAYWIEVIPPACEIEDNVYIMFAPLWEDMCYPICDPGVKVKNCRDHVKRYCDWIEEWSRKTDKLTVYNYYGCSRTAAYAERPIWKRIQKDLQDYVRLGIIGLNPEGVPDAAGEHVWYPELGMDGGYRFWEMNALTFWLYGKLSWNPYEDLDALIDQFCEKVYGPAGEAMREYYRVLSDSWETTSKTYRLTVEHAEPRLAQDYVRVFIYKPGIGHAVIDALDLALERAEEPMKDIIGEIRESYY
ncbi:MAG: DUF4838 domain-containing protein, partial [Clostridia bacterium]|nr:DUF4838 domain-containing protein [Clostridia bacterium]